MAARRLPDLAVPSQRTVSWRLFACKNAPGCSSNGIAGSCGELGVKALSVVVTQDVTHERAVTRVPCPVENGSGEILVTVPAPQSRGPWTMRVVSDDTPTLRSEVLCNLTPRCWEKQRFVLPLYARGCNDPECVRCSESNHTPGWCD